MRRYTTYINFDSGPSDSQILIFTTDSNLDFLCQSLWWCGDGTFKAAPKLWTQLYTLHGQKNGYTVPCVYALLPNKRKETYIRQVKPWVGVGNRQWIFETFLSDYEQGAFKAMLEVFPDIGEEGCFFHLYRRLDFQVKELGLMPKYRQDDAFKLRVKNALAFIPVSDVVATFESLSTSFLNDELRLLDYFENTWIRQPVGGLRLPLLFPHHMWNVRDRSGTGSSRTTNALEAFHHTFNSLLTCHHLDIRCIPLITEYFPPSADARFANSGIQRISTITQQSGNVWSLWNPSKTCHEAQYSKSAGRLLKTFSTREET